MASRVFLTTDYETKEWRDAKVALTRDLQSIMYAVNRLIGVTFDDNNVLVPDAFDPSTPTSIELTGDVVAGPGVSPQAATIQPNAVTSSKIINNAVTFPKLQDIATQILIGRNTAGTGDPESVTISQALDWLGT